MYRNCTATVLEHQQLSLYIITQFKVAAGRGSSQDSNVCVVFFFTYLQKGEQGWCGAGGGFGAKGVEKRGCFPGQPAFR